MAFNENTTSTVFEADEAVPMIRVPDVPQIYSDGPTCVEINGTNVVITYCQRRTINGARVQVPVLEMIRPLASCQCCEALRSMVERARVRQEENAASARH